MVGYHHSSVVKVSGLWTTDHSWVRIRLELLFIITELNFRKSQFFKQYCIFLYTSYVSCFISYTRSFLLIWEKNNFKARCTYIVVSHLNKQNVKTYLRWVLYIHRSRWFYCIERIRRNVGNFLNRHKVLLYTCILRGFS